VADWAEVKWFYRLFLMLFATRVEARLALASDADLSSHHSRFTAA
jgi:hypothetical protein